MLSNVVVEWLTILLRIWEVPGSNLETGYPCWGFSWFFSVPTGEFRISTLKLGPRSLAFKSFPNHHSPISLSFDAI
jgi:hypothetical protein